MLRLLAFASLLFASPAFAQTDFLSGKTDTSKPIEIQADTLEVLQKDKQAVFRGKVEARQGNVRLKADEMHVYYKEKADGSAAAGGNSVSKIDVVGNVFLATPQETVQGGKGVYDVDNSVITLNGDVVITRSKNVLKGRDLVYNLKSGQSKIQGSGAVGTDGKKERVRGYFVPESGSKKAQ